MTQLIPIDEPPATRWLDRRASPRLAPLFYGSGMLAVGAWLLVSKPRFGEVPAPRQSDDDGVSGTSRVSRVAKVGRDGVEAFAPTNVTDSIGRSLLLGGAALILTRLLDEVSGS
ncbi:hypothetical protein [Maritimibacter sp. DP1N21-5]|uniref:hypothetical protein n=1 Tax=Maritimibacter sp. DP1N21-5 TaxID=2836867 RepID=UPI001C483839|nr:hypothetical protein [Maritimibacter sp. DP1N21-5]MBV7410924.1 hypothetical protein [Maritimibacter sp. DP1N21-5]